MKRNEKYKHYYIIKEFKQQMKDDDLIHDINIQKHNVITRARLDADSLINSRLKKGKNISDEEKYEIREEKEIEFLEIFKNQFENNLKK